MIQRKESFELPPIEMKNEAKLSRMLVDLSAPYVTAKSWVVIDKSENGAVFGKKESERKEIASLTKIMTFYTTLLLADKYDMPLKTTLIPVSKNADGINGTTAGLQHGDVLSIWELFHGLMLPSGNDVGFLLAEYFGTLLKEKGHYIESNRGSWFTAPITYFLNEMNKNANLIGLDNTYFDSPHGLANNLNISTAYDIGLLSAKAMAHPDFR
jgi:D-alanyl-D-alanine carboxypeptidase (penicillin-binding protein 5/6)